MATRFDSLPQRRQLIDRKRLSDALAELLPGTTDAAKLRAAATPLLRDSLAEGRAEIARRLAAAPMRGNETAASYAFLTDQILRLAFDFVVARVHPLNNASAAERLTIAAVGGYGRGEMALHSDVDIAFLTPWKQTAWSEQVIESLLYILWDLGLKVGHSSRSLDDMVRMAKSDLTIRTALLEARYVWGDQDLYDEAARRFDREVQTGSGPLFAAEKLAERQARHERMGDSRYVVEPNLKEGKGGLRDLHTLFWIGKYVHRVRSVPELVDAGLLTREELRRFQRAENFLWAVRCHLHILSRRPEDRLTFDVQTEIAVRMGYAARPGRSPVERFMKHYFLTAKQVGDLTGLFLAHLDETLAKRGRRFGLTNLAGGLRRRAPRKLDGFILDRGRLATPGEDFFAEDPVRLLQLFALADRHEIEIHPLTLRQAGRDARLIGGKVRADIRANAFFMDVLTSPRDPETVLRWMNEAGVFGRFVPDFGRVVAQMQFDMYHHYTVDEHTVRAVGLLARIERGDLGDTLPLPTAVFGQLVSRRALYVSVLLHDIAKGRGGDHSVIGAEIAMKLCPRFGITPAETETVAWLVRWHLLMSDTAFKRDLSDFKTMIDFAEKVQSPERLRLLFLLTVVDIAAVGPGVWNDWKRQLLGELYNGAEEVLRLGHKQRGRRERIEIKQADLKARLGWSDAVFAAHVARLPEAYWVAESLDILESNARTIAAADGDQQALAIATQADGSRGATLVTLYAGDHPGLFYRIAGAIHLAGGNIIDARIHTTRDGMAVDNFLVQDPFGLPFDDMHRLERLKTAIEDALANRNRMADRLAAKKSARTRADAFTIEPNVLIDNRASNRFTVVEINAQDRPALLNALAQALFESRVTIHSAHIATYGERAVDTFYLTDLTGDKITATARLKTLERLLLLAAGREPEKKRAA
ncbi:[protein-PII] uridylyltransferase [Sphingomonas naphthae]|uniref:Bifunctional uridylyltransferase/uridylyl-removing enzyme n=1 Tax=Sphingomonas naphthae TaxID=1813468 RepID=A0ABY7TJL6_9SPHN|nr:[protein-PII] uridylyltransferase [Sphingomonas naphthae]WCT73400.1 [protein-PII] uridylyltransferase [Sphingomonas naphthae]